MGALGYPDYPGLDPREQGLYPNAGYGSLKGVRCHAVEAGAAVALSSAVGAGETSITVDDATRLPTAPFTLQASGEQLRVTAINGLTLTVTRGYNSTRPSAHPALRMLYEVRMRYVYLLAEHPVKSIGAVHIDGRRLEEAGYTAYTGQSGDELSGYEGMAVISLSARPYVGRQFNLTSADIASRQLTVSAVAFSSARVVDGMQGTYALTGGLASVGPTAWAAFPMAYGTVLGQTYSAEVENPSSTKSVGVRLIVRRLGALVSSREFTLAPSARETLGIWRQGGDEADDELVVAPLGQALRVYGIGKALTMAADGTVEDTLEMLPTGATSGRARVVSALGMKAHAAHYPSVSETGTVKSQRHEVRLKENTGTGEARVRLSAGGPIGMREVTIAAGATETVVLDVEGGRWDACTALTVLMGELEIMDIKKTVTYCPERAGAAHEDAEGCPARIVVGDELRADAEMAMDAEGSYGGVGTLIERPDHVMKHFLTERMGFAASEIDAASFSTAGGAFASAISGGYRMAFLINPGMPKSAMLSEMARQSRSVIGMRRGKWTQAFLPDTAPTAVKSISEGELAGRGSMFSFASLPMHEMANTLSVRYAPDLARAGRWLGQHEAEDAASVADYGVYRSEVELDLLCHRETAESVAAHMLRQTATPLVSVRFTVFYEHFDLGVGDTIELADGLYGGSRFFIERIHRLDRFRAEVEALQWWG